MSGSEADEIEKMRHGLDAVEHPFVHVDVDDLRAVDDLLFGHGQGFLELAGQDEFGEFGRAGDVGALADVDEIGVGPDGQRLPGRSGATKARPWAARAARISAPPGRAALMCAGVVPQQPPTMLSQPAAAQSASCGRERFRRLREAGRQHRIGQTGVGIGADVNRRQSGKLLDKRPHFLWPQRAIDADAQERKMRNGVPIGLHRLPGERAAAQIGDGEGEHAPGTRRPLCHRNSLAMAKRAALELSESNTVSTSSTSAPPSNRPRACS